MPEKEPKEAKNRNLHRAKNSKEDEFYTQLTDIEKELRHYKKHFKGKVVYCNCDEARDDVELINSLIEAKRSP